MKVFANRIIHNGNKHCVLVAANSIKEAILTLDLGVICGTVEHDYPECVIDNENSWFNKKK